MPSQIASPTLAQAFRNEMPVAEKWAYFNHAAVAPVPIRAREVLSTWAAEATAEGDTIWQSWARKVEETRVLSARLIGADTSEIALVPSTTHGINIVSEGFPWKAGDNVVTLDNEFPSNLYPWMNLESRGVETRRVPTDGGRVDLNRLEEACDARTRIITISWVGYASGWRCDPAEISAIAQRKGALFFLDAIQGLGVFPIDVSKTRVDFLAADGHKWLLGPEGAGIFYLRREHLDLLRPTGVGWHSVAQGSDFSRIEMTWKPNAARYEGGTQNMAGFMGLGASLSLLLELGIDGIAEQVLSITDYACRRLAEAGARVASHREGERRSGIVSFELPGQDPQAFRLKCLERRVAISCRDGRLRIAPHGYANEADIERLIGVIAG